MPKVIICHAIEMNPGAIWYSSVKQNLERLGYDVEVLAMPSTHKPDVTQWTQTLERATRSAEPQDTVLVGHSLGAVTILRYLQQYSRASQPAFAGVVLVAAMAHPVGYDMLNPFFEPAFQWESIQRSAATFRILLANDDPVLTPDPLGHARIFIEQLHATVMIKPTGGHFPSWGPNLPAVLPNLPEVVSLVRECLST